MNKILLLIRVWSLMQITRV